MAREGEQVYTILTTFPAHASGNVGDSLITHSAIEILKHEKGESDFRVFFREDDLGDHLDTINRSRAIIMPGFAIRDHMYPMVYRFVDNLEQIHVPLIPLGAGWKSFPGDFDDLRQFRYSPETAEFLRYISRQVNKFACREYMTCRVLRNHGIDNAIMVGDCAWYDMSSLGRRMKRPNSIGKLVFTTPHRPAYLSQAKAIVRMLSELFPEAKKYCVLQSVPTGHESEIAEFSRTRGFQVRQASHHVENLSFYQSCDLHVGYRVHGHLAFLRLRNPSVLINEDGRGLGFSYTLGIGGFDAVSRRFAYPPLSKIIFLKEAFRMAFWGVLRRAVAPAPQFCSQAVTDVSISDTIRGFLEEELSSGFRRYVGVSELIDDTYVQAMRNFLHTIP